MMRPPPLSTRYGKISWFVRNTVFMLTFIIRSNSSSSIDSGLIILNVAPTVFTSCVEPAECARCRRERLLYVRTVGRVTVEVVRLSRTFPVGTPDNGFPVRVADVHCRDPRPFRDEG